jgi:hypothetical protein
MWYVFLCKFGVSRYCVDDGDLLRLEEKIRILLSRPTTLEHLRVSKRLIEQYEKMMYINHPLTNIEQYTSLVKLWQRKFKLWKRG